MHSTNTRPAPGVANETGGTTLGAPEGLALLNTAESADAIGELVVRAGVIAQPAGLMPGRGADAVEPQPSSVRRVYERIAPLYPASSRLFHSVAHDRVLSLAGIRNGSRVLEVAIGSGEFFHRLTARNPDGHTVGIDFSYQMAAKSLRAASSAGSGLASCSAADARSLPFPHAAFDRVFVCFLLELLPGDAVVPALDEFRRVLAPGGRLGLVMTGQDRGYFNAIYSRCTKYASSVWGRQIERQVPAMLDALAYRTLHDERTWQNGFPARVMVLERPLNC